MEDAAERIGFGKALNAGQTCVAPDYVLCPSDRINAFVDAIQDALSRMYPTLRDNPDFTGIINDRQYQRLQELLADARSKGAQLVEINPAQEHFEDGCRKMPITLVLNPTEDMRVMQEEIFGPLLPVVPCKGLDDAITYINSRPKPLALYYFGYERDAQKRLLAGTHSGGVCINDSLMPWPRMTCPSVASATPAWGITMAAKVSLPSPIPGRCSPSRSSTVASWCIHLTAAPFTSWSTGSLFASGLPDLRDRYGQGGNAAR